MVRLKDEKYRSLNVGVYKFQFQYGAIKSRQAIEDVYVEYLFQFQYGAIKRRYKRLRK